MPEACSGTKPLLPVVVVDDLGFQPAFRPWLFLVGVSQGNDRIGHYPFRQAEHPAEFRAPVWSAVDAAPAGTQPQALSGQQDVLCGGAAVVHPVAGALLRHAGHQDRQGRLGHHFGIGGKAHDFIQLGLFTVPGQVAQGYASAAMQLCEANASAIAGGNPVEKMPPVERVEDLAITTEMLSQHYPLFASSLLNLIQNSENKIKG